MAAHPACVPVRCSQGMLCAQHPGMKSGFCGSLCLLGVEGLGLFRSLLLVHLKCKMKPEMTQWRGQVLECPRSGGSLYL